MKFFERKKFLIIKFQSCFDILTHLLNLRLKIFFKNLKFLLFAMQNELKENFALVKRLFSVMLYIFVLDTTLINLERY